MDNHNDDQFVSVIDKGQNYSEPQILTRICYGVIPSSIHSLGILGDDKHSSHFLKYSLPLLELQIGIICIIHHTLHFFLKRFGMTELVCQILTGIILGPTFLGRCNFMRNVIFPHESQDLVFTASSFGYLIFLFLCTVKLDLAKILKTGKLVMYSGVGNVAVPLVLGLSLIAIERNDLEKKGMLNEATNVAISQCFSAFSIIAHVLEELKILNSEIGRLVLSSALIGDILGIALMTAVSTFAQTSTRHIIIDGFAVLIFNLASAFVFHPAMLWVIRHTPQGSPVNSSYIYTIMAIVFLSEAYFQFFHQYVCVGAAILGFAVPSGPPLGSALVEKFETVITKVFMPVAVAQAVMRADLTIIFTRPSRIKIYILLLFFVYGSKFLMSLLASLFSEMPLKDSYLFASVMICRGVIELSIYLLARDTKTIGEEAYAFLVFCIFVSSIVVSIIVKCSYDPSKRYAGYHKRDISSLKPKSELRILACIHKPDNVTSLLKLLDAFHPAKDRPIDVCVLHLIQLIGRFTPILVSNQMKRQITDPQSHNVIVSFTQYQQNNWGTVTVSTYTSITKPNLMSEDVSILGLDKLTSLILLPLHRRWSFYGTIEAEDQYIRTINLEILGKAPCSVGIFFDRGKLGRPSSMASPKPPISICMIFLGGNDDREALSLAKRIAKDTRAHLTVIQIIPEVTDINLEDVTIDSWALGELKSSTEDNQSVSNIVFKEVLVKDGPETALVIHSIMDEFDLFIIGRRHGMKSPQTKGLSEWTELHELGTIGDLFASNDINTRAAVLVVQQQKQIRVQRHAPQGSKQGHHFVRSTAENSLRSLPNPEEVERRRKEMEILVDQMRQEREAMMKERESFLEIHRQWQEILLHNQTVRQRDGLSASVSASPQNSSASASPHYTP